MSPSMDQLWTVVAESECKPVDDVIGTRPMSHDSELKKRLRFSKVCDFLPRRREWCVTSPSNYLKETEGLNFNS